MLLQLVTSVLDALQKSLLAVLLAADLEKSDLLATLCELLPFLQSLTKDSIYPDVLKYVFRVIETPSIGYSKIDNLIKGFDLLQTDILAHIDAKLSEYLFCNTASIIPEIITLVSFDAPVESTTEIDILSILQFLDYVFLNSSLSIQNSPVDSKLVALLGSNIELVSKAVSGLFRWRINAVHNPWEVIFILEQQPSVVHKSNAYILWLRFLTSRGNETMNLTDLDQLTSEKYWICIQNGLKSGVAEHRKFSLSILQHSVQKIPVDFSNDSMKWEVAKGDLYKREWARFVTLFEIIAIDTSAHQAEAGSKDIIGFLRPESLIHPSWGFCLLYTGFTASMDSVRKFMLSLFISLPDHSLPLLKYSFDDFRDVFLPYSMLAQHFHVRRVDFVSNENSCEYGTQLSNFISRIVKENKANQIQLGVLVTNILASVAKCETFSPAKIYVTKGLLDGLDKEQCIEYGSEAEKYFLELIESQPEGEVFTKTYQTINLLLIANFKLSTEAHLVSFISILQKFGKFNSFSLIKENFGFLKEHLLPFANDFENIFQQVPEKALLYSLAKAINNTELPITDVQRAEAFSQGIIDGHFNQLPILETKASQLDFYETLAKVDTLQITLDEHFFDNLVLEVQADDAMTLLLSASKLAILSKLAHLPSFVSLSSLIELHLVLFTNMKSVIKVDKTFFKVRNYAFALYYRFLSKYISGINISEVNDIIGVIDSDESNGSVAIEIVNLIVLLMKTPELSKDRSFTDLIKILNGIWRAISAERLFLNQKSLHVSLIQALLDKQVILNSIEDEEVGEILRQFSIDIVRLSEGRRSFLPTLTKCISDFQIANPNKFDQCLWIPEVLVRCFIVLQLQSNVFKLENIIAKLFDDRLSNSKSSDLYREVYGEVEAAARINIVAILASTASESFSRNIWEWIFSNEKEFFLFEVIKKTDGFEEWRRVQLFTLLLLSLRNIDKEFISSNYLKTLTCLIETEPSPLVRVYIEWIVSLCLVEDESTKDEFLTKFNSSTESPTTLVSYERMLFLMVQQLPKQKEEQVMEELLSVLLAAATSNKAVTRHFSLSLTCAVKAEIEKKDLNISEELKSVVKNIYDSALTSEAYGTYRSGDATLWDIKQDFDLVSITGVVLLRASERDLDYITRESYLQCLTKEQQDALMIPVGHNNEKLWVDRRKQINQKKGIHIRDFSGTSSTPLQTKSGALNSILDVDEDTKSVHRSDLIVVASLVDKPPNLGGICRLSDVLGAGLLTLHDLKVKDHAQFKTVAVTADKWMPMIEVKPQDIVSFFHAKKKEGYTLIGLEQTDKSVQLDSNLKFPKKSVILLGREKEGIPGELLAELDFCVEIKQVGVIRSMNIQTATAVIVHAYSMQHC